MPGLLQRLELELGPDTSDLGIRVGLNSGPVTAGVLRADRARFQLFGDVSGKQMLARDCWYAEVKPTDTSILPWAQTVNTASRMESTGERNKIHISKDTADLLIASGKNMWVTPRGEKVHAKGKGQLEVS